MGKRKRQGKRVAFRRNRQAPRRQKQWMPGKEVESHVEDATKWETVRAKGELSRMRTVANTGEQTPTVQRSDQRKGTVIAVRGQFVEVDDGEQMWLCSVRRILRTRLIGERHPVVAGDAVMFSPIVVGGQTSALGGRALRPLPSDRAIVTDTSAPATEGQGGQDAHPPSTEGTFKDGVIEEVLPRRSTLHRCDGRRFHVIAANVDQVMIVSSIREPIIKEHLIDRYLVAIHAGGPEGIICLNKVDLDDDNWTEEILGRYQRIGYRTLATSTATGQGVEELRAMLKDRITMLAGQSGVGKSSLINAIQPDLNLKTAHVSITTDKGRHTTTTAMWYRLEMGGAIIDTPGIRALDVAMVPLNELETHFVEFLDKIPHCKFADCVHIHEDGCAVKAALEAGEIDISRYESYVELFMDRSEQQRRQSPR